MDNETRNEIELLKAQFEALASERLPKVDRASKRRDKRQIFAGFGLFVVAVLVAGTMGASALSGSNTVLSDDIKDLEVHGSDINGNAVFSSKVKDNSLTGADVNEKTLNLGGNCGPGVTGGSAIILGKTVGDMGLTLSTEPVAFPYNCSGEEVLASQSVSLDDPGNVTVFFKGNAKRIAQVTIDNHNPTTAITATVDDLSPGYFLVRTLDAAGVPRAADFEIVIY